MIESKQNNTDVKEAWKDIPGYDGVYQISNHGRVRFFNEVGGALGFVDEPWIMKSKKERNGYLRIGLYKNSNHKSHSIHRLVAEAFVPNPENKSQVNHKDLDPLNNHYSNLEWCTPSEDTRHSVTNGSFGAMGEKNHKTHLSKDDVLEIRSAYRLGCFSYSEIAEAYDIHKSSVGAIITRRTWRHL